MMKKTAILMSTVFFTLNIFLQTLGGASVRATVAAAAVKFQTASSDAPLESTHWKLVEVNGKAATGLGKEPYLQLASEGKRIQGMGGCNRLSGSYTLNGANLKFGKIGATRMACPDGMDVEDAFVKALEATTDYKIAGRNLELYAGSKLLAKLEASASLVDTHWKLIELDGKAVTAAVKEPHLQLASATKSFSGTGGCNRIMGAYTLNGSDLKFGTSGMTRMFCPTGVDSELAKALKATTTYKIADGRLELYDGDKLLAKFEPGRAK